MSSYLLGVTSSPNITTTDSKLTHTEIDEVDSSILNITIFTTVNASNGEIIEKFISESRRNGMALLIMYIVLYVIGLFGNLTVLFHISKQHSRSKVNFYIIQLAIADLIVINCTILTEIGWRITVQWVTSELGCKFVQALRIFGLYLTSNIVICITLDRFFAFVFPLSVFKSHERNKHLLNASYILAFLTSIPNTTGNCVANDVTAQVNECEPTVTSPFNQGATDGSRNPRHLGGSRKLIEPLRSCCSWSVFRQRNRLSRKFSDTTSNVDPSSSSHRSMRYDKSGETSTTQIMTNGHTSTPDECDEKAVNFIEPEASQSNKYSDTSYTIVARSINSPRTSCASSINDAINSPDKSDCRNVNSLSDRQDVGKSVLLPPSKINCDTGTTLDKQKMLQSRDKSNKVNHVKNVLVNLTRGKRIKCDNSSLTDTIEVICTEIDSTNMNKDKTCNRMSKRNDTTKVTVANGKIECTTNELTDCATHHGTPLLLHNKSSNGAGKCVKFSSETSGETTLKLSDAIKRNRSASTISQFSSSVHSTRRTILMARAKKRTLIMSILIVVTFCICWTPYSFMLAVEVCNIKSISIPIEIKGLLYWFAICNSVLNPFVHSYHIFVNVFCKQLHRRDERTTVCETSTSQRTAYSPGINSKKFKFDQSLYKESGA